MSFEIAQIALEEVLNFPYTLLDMIASDVLSLVGITSILTSMMLMLALVLSSKFFKMGEMSEPVYDKIKKNMFDFVFFRIVYIGAVSEFSVPEVSVWHLWVSCIAFLRFILLVTDEYFTVLGTLYFSAARRNEQSTLIHRAFVLVLLVLVADVVLVYFVYLIFADLGYSVLAMLLYENAVIFLCFAKVAHKYGLVELRLYQQSRRRLRDGQGADDVNMISSDDIFNLNATELYIADFLIESFIHILTLVHSVHVWGYYGISFTLIDLPLFLNMRRIMMDLSKRVTNFITTIRAFQAVNTLFPDASDEQLCEPSSRVSDSAADSNEEKVTSTQPSVRKTCSICLEDLTAGKLLPCQHIFHAECLRTWLHEQTTCPVCRAQIVNTPQIAPQPLPVEQPHVFPAQVLDGIIAREEEDAKAALDAALAESKAMHDAAEGKRNRDVMADHAAAAIDRKEYKSESAAHVNEAPHSLFRFSTGQLAHRGWLPNFAFEVVRGGGTSLAAQRDATTQPVEEKKNVDLPSSSTSASEEGKHRPSSSSSSEQKRMAVDDSILPVSWSDNAADDEDEYMQRSVTHTSADALHNEFWAGPNGVPSASEEPTDEQRKALRRAAILRATENRL